MHKEQQWPEWHTANASLQSTLHSHHSEHYGFQLSPFVPQNKWHENVERDTEELHVRQKEEGCKGIYQRILSHCLQKLAEHF